jgi:adenylosuccinate synthase
MSIKYTDIIVDMQYGDTGKGKVAHHLAASGDYNFVIRYNGGPNAGHTIYHNGEKIVTHQVPVGVLYGIPSMIGLGCVISIPKLLEELEMLNRADITTAGLVFIDKRAHIITDEHLSEDGTDTQIGTTRQGVGPAYRAKYGRTGIRAGDYLEGLDHPIKDHIEVIDFYQHSRENDLMILAEGAQGFHLDIDWGNYPYVTSSHCTVGSVCLNGIPYNTIRKVYGTMKAYETYVGNNDNYTDETNEYFQKIQEIGQEYGATTGRSRKVNHLNMERVVQAININGVTDVIINKIDILDQVGRYTNIAMNGDLVIHYGRDMFTSYIEEVIRNNTDTQPNIIWSSSPNGI